MNERQLHDALGRALQAARAASPAATSPPAPSAPVPQRPTPLQKGRYSRWHADPDPVVEEETWLLTYLDVMTLLLVIDRKSTRLNSSHIQKSRMPSSA